MNNDKILRKISALLNVTVENGATVGEALAAANKAQALIAKYHVSLLDSNCDTEPVDEDIFPSSRKWINILANIVCQNLSCRLISSTCNRKTLLKFIGRDSDRKVALQTFQMLLSVCQNGIAKEKIRAKLHGSSSGVEIAYASGFIRAVEEEMGKQCKALLLSVPSDVDEHIKRHYPNLRSVTTRVSCQYRNKDDIDIAKANGYQDGKNIAGQRKIAGDFYA